MGRFGSLVGNAKSSSHTLALCIDSFNPHTVGKARETTVWHPHRPLGTGQAGCRAQLNRSFLFSLPSPIFALLVYLGFALWGGLGQETKGG